MNEAEKEALRKLIHVNGISNRIMSNLVKVHKSLDDYLATDRHCTLCGREVTFVSVGRSLEHNGKSRISPDGDVYWQPIDHDGGDNKYVVTHNLCLLRL